MDSVSTERTVSIFRYDPDTGGQGRFRDYRLDIPRPEITTILDVLLRLQREQDPGLAFRYACRVNMCGSCGMVINGREGLACKTNVADLPTGLPITLRPLNHFPVIKDLVVDMDPFFAKYEDSLPFFEPREPRTEPCVMLPETPERVAIGMATDCIACGCCVSSCTMVGRHEEACGPAALNRAFTLLVDSRDALFEPRLARALDSCAHCRTEFNCTDVCPKQISGTRAIKHIQRLAFSARGRAALAASDPRAEEKASACACGREQGNPLGRRRFLRTAGGLVGAGVIVSLTGILGAASVAPTLAVQPAQWVPVDEAQLFRVGEITPAMVTYERRRDFHAEQVAVPVLVRRDSDRDFVCFSSRCPHLGCSVGWDALTRRFKCACHGGAFDRDGNVVAGPPPAPLPRLPWKLENGVLKVEVV